MEELKNVKPWKSKTNIVGLIVAIASFFPNISVWIAAHPEAFMQVVAGIIVMLRFITKGKISIK